MQLRQALSLSILIGGASLICAGCATTGSTVPKTTPAVNQPATQTNSQSNSASGLGATQKSGTTTKTGRVIQGGQKFVLQNGNQSVGIDSYSIDLSKYANQQVTVSGEYSGDTLFVTSIQ